jgi:hypothetical protein
MKKEDKRQRCEKGSWPLFFRFRTRSGALENVAIIKYSRPVI